MLVRPVTGQLQPAPAATCRLLAVRWQPCGSSRRSLAAPQAVPEALEAVEQEQWVACSELVQQRCGLDADAADAALLKAFGWKGQGFWRQERVKQVPCQEQVTAVLDYLASLGISDAHDLGPLLTAFPEALGLHVQLMEENVSVLREKWYMKGNVLLNSIKRKPRALGNNIDCEGTCAGLCTRCWAQF
ncbi:hypothetical protein D9Q98_010036 [Chlorella vulgaris]|uniref:Uncharacterized protein n=1 Tax=Chlorella vulgaris TaxID=3077 RepID=A0A9D4TNE6_CHLVU|nr:hypothetical protein D9Q98_010036 [Chlorella vulgaris]